MRRWPAWTKPGLSLGWREVNCCPTSALVPASCVNAFPRIKCPDLWGRVRRGFEGARADAQASLAAFYTMLLTLQGDVAQDYFALRALDAEIATVTGTVDLRKEQVRLVRSRFEGGIGNELDIARAETELAATEAEAASLARRRNELENAIAILAGANPAVFKLPPLDNANTRWNPQPPVIPAG